jgi:glycosyltransferase involved in cell wall biosynthesis
MHKATPFFSIIIPTYNHAHLIKRCLDSVLCQTYQYWEAIVVNNFSDDNTIEIVNSYVDSRVRLINFDNGGIIAASRNKGIYEAKGDWICFLDSDDWWYPNKLKICLQYVDDFDFVHHDLDIYKAKNYSKKRARGRKLSGNLVKDLIINGNAFVNSSVILKKKIVDLVGAINEDRFIVGVEDYEYWIRIIRATNRVNYIKKSLGAYWIGGNISYSIKHIEKEEILLNRYIELLNESEKSEALFRFKFNCARRFHYNKMFVNAKKSYLGSLGSNNIELKFKSIVGICACSLRFKI